MYEYLLGGICFLIIISFGIVYFYKRERKERKKFFLSQVFIIVIFSVTCYMIDLVNQQYNETKLFFTLAIMFSFLGDLLMDQRVILTGIKIVDGFTGFSIAHILYITGMILWLKENELKINTQFYIILIGTVLLLLGGYLLTAFNFEKKIFKFIGLFYALLIGTSLFFALIIGTWIKLAAAKIVMVGVILFFTSDLILAFREAKKPDFNLDYFIHNTYVLGQFLIQAGIFVFF